MSQSSSTSDTLKVRVDNLDSDIQGFRQDLRDVRAEMVTRKDFEALSGQINSITTAQRPNWQVWSLGLSFLIAVGWLVYRPIDTGIVDLKEAMRGLGEKVVTARQYDADGARTSLALVGLRQDLTTAVNSTIQQQRYNADKAARDDEIKILRERFEKVLTRSEFDAQHGDIKAFITSMMTSRQRQLDDLGHRIDRLENIQLKK